MKFDCRWFGKLTGIVAAAGMLVGGTAGTASAATLNDFLVNETVFGGPAGGTACIVDATTNCLVGDKFTGNYSEVITITGANTFSTVAYWDVGQLAYNDGNSAYAGIGLNNQYAMYALFSATGTFSTDAAGNFNFSATGGGVSLYVDQDLDGIAPPLGEGKTLPSFAPGTVTVTGTADTLMGSASLFSGTGSSQPAPCNVNGVSSNQCGGFALLFYPFNWSATGLSYFVYPTNPFYLTADLRGQFNTFSIPVGCGPTSFGSATCSQIINGSADASLAGNPVPEPATLTLLGVGLLATGAARRRRQKATKS